MENKTVTLHPSKKLCGSINILSSKSELHRLIICASLADRECRIKYCGVLSNDIHATINCMQNLGAKISTDEQYIYINKTIDKEIYDKKRIFCSESGSTARFILPIATLICKGGAVIDGCGKLPERPLDDLCECLEKQGAEFTTHHLPTEIKKTASIHSELKISGNISSQYLSGLLMASPLAGSADIRLTTELTSSGYVDITIDAMNTFGINVKKENNVYHVSGTYKVPDDTVNAGGDWSNAAFFMCAAGEEKYISINGLSIESLQKDKQIYDLLSDIGFETSSHENTIFVKRGKNIRPFTYDAQETPDLVPIISVLAASVNGVSTVKNISRLKFKESDRIKAVCDMINSLGGIASSDGENIYIEGNGKLKGGTVNGYNDHRIVMSAATASVISDGDITITDADAVRKSYPDFFECFKKLQGGKYEQLRQ